jgi:hypothetical protein
MYSYNIDIKQCFNILVYHVRCIVTFIASILDGIAERLNLILIKTTFSANAIMHLNKKYIEQLKKNQMNSLYQ